VLERHLADFGINNLSMVNIVSDRGSNFVAAFRDLNPLFCFAHRLNNIDKLTFFQNVQRKKKQASNITTGTIKAAPERVKFNEQYVASSNGNNCLSSEGTTEDEEQIIILPTIPLIRKKRKIKSILTNNQQESSYKMSIDDIPLAGRNVLNILTKCKKISGLNKEIEDNGRKSILKSFKIIKKILCSKQQQKLVMNVDQNIIKQIILVLKPVKHVVKLTQNGNSPFLFMVLLSAETLRNVMSSYDELINYDIAFESNKNLDELDDDLSEELEVDLNFWNFDSNQVDSQNSENEAEDFELRGTKPGELDRYLNFEYDKFKVDRNPLMFWKENQDKFLRLARYARCIHSIPATSASVERQFFGAGLIINER
ncbi:unnamed protein product, partial [Adineta ricciae]